jgi:hypothetical protein
MFLAPHLPHSQTPSNTFISPHPPIHPGIFTSVIFIDDPDAEESLETAIRQTLEQTTVRIYGGHIFAAGGDLGM